MNIIQIKKCYGKASVQNAIRDNLRADTVKRQTGAHRPPSIHGLMASPVQLALGLNSWEILKERG